MLRYLILSLFFCLSCLAQDPFQEGIHCFLEKKYDHALAIFTQEDVNEQKPLGALIGRLFCQVALGQFDQIDSMMLLASQKLIESAQCIPSPKRAPMTLEEHHASYLCRRKVREIANQMRQTVEKLVRETVGGIFEKIRVLRQLYPFIDTLERIGIDCCQNSLPWSCCLNPLIEQLEAWNVFGINSSLDSK